MTEEREAATGVTNPASTLDPEHDKPREVPEEPADLDRLQSEVDRMSQQLLESENALSATREQMLRMQADFENYKRRQQNALEDDKVRAREGILAAMLPLLDNLERALAALETTGNVEALGSGVKLIVKQMRGIFEKEGLSEISADRQIFDPSVHEVVMTEDRDDVEDHTVLETLQKGYRLGTRVLRPSLVKVSRAASDNSGQINNMNNVEEHGNG